MTPVTAKVPRPRAGAPSVRDGGAGGGSGALLARGLAPGGPQQREPFLKQFFQLGDAAAFQQHVPVGAGDLDRLVFCLLYTSRCV